MNVTLFGNRVVANVVSQIEVISVGPSFNIVGAFIKRENVDTETTHVKIKAEAGQCFYNRKNTRWPANQQTQGVRHGIDSPSRGWKKPTLPIPQSQTAGLPTCETINIRCLIHPFCGTLLQQLWQTHTDSFQMVPGWFLPLSLPEMHINGEQGLYVHSREKRGITSRQEE